MTSFDRIWQLPNTHVDSGRIPGYVGAVRIGDRAEVQAVGRTAIERDSPPMSGDTLFRLASMSKPVGAALTMCLVQDLTIALDDEIARWLPEAGRPRVLITPDAPLDSCLASPI
jgi:CubicO group peptidase (beta-lactamase class C family)